MFAMEEFNNRAFTIWLLPNYVSHIRIIKNKKFFIEKGSFEKHTISNDSKSYYKLVNEKLAVYHIYRFGTKL